MITPLSEFQSSQAVPSKRSFWNGSAGDCANMKASGNDRWADLKEVLQVLQSQVQGQVQIK